MSSTTAMAPRRPLAPLPLSHFAAPSNAFPSPVSLPLKRPASSASTSTTASAGPSTRSSTSTAGSAKMRKVSYTDDDGTETVKRTRVREVTPRAKSFLEKDDLGLGRSPARRLFVDEQEGKSYGITGAVSAAAPTASPGQRSLAPSPPMGAKTLSNATGIITPTSPIFSSVPLENGLDIHDPGFTIYSDTSPRPLRCPPTPESKRPSAADAANPPFALDAPAHIPSSPCSVLSYNSQLEDQENVPPLSHSAASTPSKRSSLASPTSKRSSLSAEDEWAPPSGSRSRRTIERSKLGLESFISLAAEEDERTDADPADELTPGRKVVRRRQAESGRKMLMREVNRI